MPTQILRLFSRPKTGKIGHFEAFAAAIAQRWQPGLEVRESRPAGSPDGADSVPGGAYTALYRDQDRPLAVLSAVSDGEVGDAGDPEALARLVRAALGLLEPDRAEALLPVPLPPETLRPEYHDYRLFSSAASTRPLLMFAPYLGDRFADLLAERGPKELAAALAAAMDRAQRAAEDGVEAPGAGPPPVARIAVVEPRGAWFSRLLFPAALDRGAARIRFIPHSWGLVPGTAAVDPGAADREVWFRFGLRGAAADAAAWSGFWVFERDEAEDAPRFAALCAGVARLAGTALAGEFGRYGVMDGLRSGAVSGTPPTLGAAPVLEYRGIVAVGYARLGLRIIVPRSYPVKLAAGCGASGMEAPAAVLFLDRRLSVHPQATVPEERLLNFSELLETMADQDYRILVQNFLTRQYQGAALAELLIFRRTELVDGQPTQRILRPPVFDLRRFSQTLPGLARDAFADAVRRGAAAADPDQWLRRQEEAYASLVAEARAGSLELGYRGAALIRTIFKTYVFPRQRRRLDDLVARDYPLALLRAQGGRRYRAVVDAADYHVLAAALVGREAALAELARWCSRGKQRNIREELARLAGLLASGAIDPDAICMRRGELEKKLEIILDRERRESLPGGTKLARTFK